jgi:hypothetical protein
MSTEHGITISCGKDCDADDVLGLDQRDRLDRPRARGGS